MPRDVNGNYTLPLPPVITGTTIDIAWANPTMDDVAAAMTDSLSRTGSGGMLDAFKSIDGLVGAPGIGFTTEPTLGLYRPSAGVMGVAIGGAEVAGFDATNKITVTRDHGAGLQKYPVADSFTELVAGGDAFDLKFAGFLSDGKHVEYTSDLDLIVNNSLFKLSGTVTNAPADYVLGDGGFLHTFMATGSTTVATQILYGLVTSNNYKVWMRHKSTTWGAWKLVVDNGAFPLRLDGFEDTGSHAQFAGDLDDIVTNVGYYIAATAGNTPADLSLDGFVRHYALSTAHGVQVIWGLTDPDFYKVWTRQRISNVWSAWVLINDGNAFFIEADGTVRAFDGKLISGNDTTTTFPLVIAHSGASSSGGGKFQFWSFNETVRAEIVNDMAAESLTLSTFNSISTLQGRAILQANGNLSVNAAAPVAIDDLTRKDYVDALVGGGAVFDSKYDGFSQDGTHKLYSGDLNDILNNSLFNFLSTSVTNEPADFALGWGFLHTFMKSNDFAEATQVLYGMNNENKFKQWMRHRNSATWGAWRLTTDGNAVPIGAQVSMPGLSALPSSPYNGLVIADGGVLNRNSYPELWALVSGSVITEASWQTKSNSGANGVGYYSDGPTPGVDFRLPDLRGEFLRGTTTSTGIGSSGARDPDRAEGNLDWQDSEVVSHAHTHPVGSGSNSGAAGVGSYLINGAGVSGSFGGSETRGRNIPVLVCIKAL